MENIFYNRHWLDVSPSQSENEWQGRIKVCLVQQKTKKLKDYRITVHLFGKVDSLCSAIWYLKQHPAAMQIRLALSKKQ